MEHNIYDDEIFFQAYSQMSRSREGLKAAGEWHQLQPLFPNMTGKTVLDLGCGYGWHCKYAAEQGASKVLGIDLSEKMIEEARKQCDDSKITYQVAGMDTFEYPENAYDLVVSNLALHYMADLNSIYQNVYKTLRPEGIFLLNIEHPTFTAGVRESFICDEDNEPMYWPVDNYFYPGERITNFLGVEVKKHHHTLTQILMGLLQNGFEIEIVEEAMPSPGMMDIPGMKDEMRRPMMLLVRAQKK